MDISAVNAATSAYGVNSQNAKAVTPTQNSNITQHQQTDSVSLSPEAQKLTQTLSTQEEANQIYQEWQDTGLLDKHQIRFESVKPYDSLLPQNQDFIKQLQSEYLTAGQERQAEIKGFIDEIHRWGDKEDLSSNASVNRRSEITALSTSMGISSILSDMYYPDVKFEADSKGIKMSPLTPRGEAEFLNANLNPIAASKNNVKFEDFKEKIDWDDLSKLKDDLIEIIRQK